MPPTAHEVTQELLRSESWEVLRTKFLSNHWLNRWLNCWLNQCSRKRYLDIGQWKTNTYPLGTLSKASLNTGQVRKTSLIFFEPCISLTCAWFTRPFLFPEYLILQKATVQLRLYSSGPSIGNGLKLPKHLVLFSLLQYLWNPLNIFGHPKKDMGSTGTRASMAFAEPVLGRLKLTLQCLNLKSWIQAL